jgi:membrane-associated protease RseP (regulator of RpoE activity)
MGDDKNSRGQGVRILHVRAGGPAAKAGLREGDLIVSLGGMHLRQMSELADMLDLYKPGDHVALEVVRGGQSQKFEITLAVRPQIIVTVPVEGSPAQPPAPLHPEEGPALKPPAPPAAKQVNPTSEDHPSQIEQLQRRIEQLEQRVGELERRK